MARRVAEVRADGIAPHIEAGHGRLLLGSVKNYAPFMLDDRGRVISWNAGAEAIKGYTAEEIIGSHISRFYTPQDAADGRPQRLLAAATKDGRVEDEGWRVRKD